MMRPPRRHPRKEDSMNWKRFAPLTGVAFVVLIVISFIVSGETPDFDDSAQEVVSFYSSNESSQIVGAILGAYAVLFFVFFAGTLRAVLRRTEEAPGVLNSEFFIPLTVGVGVFMIAAGIAILRGVALPRWLGWTGLVIGIAAVTPLGFFAFLAMVAWVLAASVTLYLQAEGTTSAPPPRTGPAA